jgi:hypothetical protein
MTAAFILVVDAAIVIVPSALADPAGSPPPSVTFSPDQAAQVALASPTLFLADPTPGPATVANAYIPIFPPGPESATPTPAPTPTPTARPKRTPAPTPRDTVWNARIYVKNRVGAKGYACINAVWTVESKWNPRAGTPTGAYGIPQAFPGTRMAAFGSNWRSSPLTQVKWGLWYVTTKYGSACAAYTFWKAYGWY